MAASVSSGFCQTVRRASLAVPSPFSARLVKSWSISYAGVDASTTRPPVCSSEGLKMLLST